MRNILHATADDATMRTLTQNVRPIAHLENGRPCANSPLRVLGKPQRAASCAREGEAVLTSDTSITAEEWRSVIGFEGLYDISNMGRVRSHDRYGPHWRGGLRIYRGMIMKPFIRDGKYQSIALSKPGVRSGKRQRFFSIHRLVAEAFIGPIPSNFQVNHKDGNKLNNVVSNLEIVTARQNMRHASDTGLLNIRTGEDNHASKLKDRDVEVIREAANVRLLPYSMIASVFGVSITQVCAIANYKARA